jgi:hypothetical protein
MTGPALEAFWISGRHYAWRVLLIKGIPCTSRLLQASNGDTKARVYLSLNPRRPI